MAAICPPAALTILTLLAYGRQLRDPALLDACSCADGAVLLSEFDSGRVEMTAQGCATWTIYVAVRLATRPDTEISGAMHMSRDRTSGALQCHLAAPSVMSMNAAISP